MQVEEDNDCGQHPKETLDGLIQLGRDVQDYHPRRVHRVLGQESEEEGGHPQDIRPMSRGPDPAQDQGEVDDVGVVRGHRGAHQVGKGEEVAAGNEVEAGQG